MKFAVIMVILMLSIIPFSSVAKGSNITTYFKVGTVKITFSNGNATIETPIGIPSSYYLEVSTQNTTGFISYSLSGPYWMSIPLLQPSLSVNPPLNLTFNGVNYGSYTANITAQDQLSAKAWTDVVDVVILPVPQQPPSPKLSSFDVSIFTLLAIAAAAVIVMGTVHYIYDGGRSEIGWSERWYRQ